MTHGFGGSSVLPLCFYSSCSLNSSFSPSVASTALNWSLCFALIKDRSLLYIALYTAPYTVVLTHKSCSLFHRESSLCLLFSQVLVRAKEVKVTIDLSLYVFFYSLFYLCTFFIYCKIYKNFVKLSNMSRSKFYVSESKHTKYSPAMPLNKFVELTLILTLTLTVEQCNLLPWNGPDTARATVLHFTTVCMRLLPVSKWTPKLSQNTT